MNKTEIKKLVKKVLQKSNKFEDVFTKVDKVFITQREIKPILIEIKNSKRKSYQYPTEIISKFQPKSIKEDLIKIFEHIQIGTYKSDQQQVIDLINQGIFMPNVFFENRKRYTPCGIFYHKNGRLDVRILNQILILQSNNILVSADEIQKIKTNEYTFAFYRQILPDKYFLLVRTSSMNARNHQIYQGNTEKYYKDLLGNNFFIAMNLNVAIPFSYDINLYLNLSSKVFEK